MQHGTLMWQTGPQTDRQTNSTQILRRENEQPHRISKRKKLRLLKCMQTFIC